MNIVIGSLFFCCVLLSICMVATLFLAISVLCKLNKILKNIGRLTTILNFEAKILAPLLLGKKFLVSWLRKRKKNQNLDKDIEDIFCCEEDKNEMHWILGLLSKTKWVLAAACVWCMFRNRD